MNGMYQAFCEACGEELLFSDEDLREFQDGDIITCDCCHTDLEIVKTDEGLELHRHVWMTTCPKCSEEFELTDEMLQKSLAQCPHCKYKFALEWEE